MARQDSKPDGRLFITAATSGEHLFCFAVKQYIPNSYCRLYPEVYLGDPGDPRITSPVEAQLHEISYAVANNNELVTEIREEQKLQRDRERLFRDMSGKLNSNVYRLAVVQVVVLGLTAAWQMRYLKRFFQAKKLV